MKLRRYMRLYANGNKVRSMGGSKDAIYDAVIHAFPHIFKLVEFVEPPREPIMVMGFYVSRKSKRHHLKWIIRGYEEAERYRPTTIFIPNKEIVFEPGEDRSQGSCFMKLLEAGYTLASYENFLEKFDVVDPDMITKIIEMTPAVTL